MSIGINLKNDADAEFWEVSVTGELDVSTADQFKEYLHKLIDEDIKNIRFDLEGLDYIDSTGLGVIIGILKRIKVENKEIYIKSPRDNVKKIFSITGLDKIFKMEG
ncbi:STAS domain-containing protein [Intestinibacter sp.]